VVVGSIRSWPRVNFRPLASALAGSPLLRSSTFEHLAFVSSDQVRSEEKIAYLLSNDVELVLDPVLVCQPQRLDIGLSPDSHALAKSLQAHLQSGNLVGSTKVGLEPLSNVLPGHALLILELDEQLVLFGQFHGAHGVVGIGALASLSGL